MKNPSLHTVYKSLLPLCLSLLLFCAHQVPPSGGPEDKLPPSVNSTTPVSGSTKHPLRQKAVFQFSEWVSPRNIERAITVFPPLPGGHRIAVQGKAVEVIPNKAFAESTTYHIELTTGLQDLHQNPIGKPYALVFSTGPALDSSSISGCIVDNENKTRQPKVALFRAGTTTSVRDSLLLATPDYLSQTDSFGSFAIQNIKPGRYAAMAFADANGDNRFQPGREPAFVPVDKEILISGSVDSLLFFPVTCDTATRRITTLRPISSVLLWGEWNRPALTAQDTLSDLKIRIECSDPARKAPAIRELVRIYHSRKFALILDTSLELTGYKAIYLPIPARSSDTAAPLLDTVRFNGITSADTLKPRMIQSSAGFAAELNPVIRTTWNKAVRLLPGPYPVFDTLGDTVEAYAGPMCGDTTVFSLKRRLKPGSEYRLYIPFDSVTDLNGTHPSDSVDSIKGYTVKRTTLPGDSLCIAVSGKDACAKSMVQGKWVFRPIQGAAPQITADAAGSFRFDSIPAGKGMLTRFSDLDGDGMPSPGSLFPWIAPEPFIPLPDTIEARARWEIENVTVNGCTNCSRPATIQDSTATQETQGSPQ